MIDAFGLSRRLLELKFLHVPEREKMSIGHQLGKIDAGARSRERQMIHRCLRGLLVELAALLGRLEALNQPTFGSVKAEHGTRVDRIRTLFRTNPKRVLCATDVWNAIGKERTAEHVGSSLWKMAALRDTIERVAVGRYRLAQASESDIAPSNDERPRLRPVRKVGKTASYCKRQAGNRPDQREYGSRRGQDQRPATARRPIVALSR